MRGAHKVCESAKPDFPSFEREDSEKIVGKGLPRELEEHRLFRPEKEGPGGATMLAEGQVPSVVNLILESEF